MIKKIILGLMIFGCVKSAVNGMEYNKISRSKSLGDIPLSMNKQKNIDNYESIEISSNSIAKEARDVLSYEEMQQVLQEASRKKFSHDFDESLKYYELAFFGSRSLLGSFKKSISGPNVDIRRIQEQILTEYVGEREAVKSLVYLHEALHGKNSPFCIFWSDIAQEINVVVK